DGSRRDEPGVGAAQNPRRRDIPICVPRKDEHFFALWYVVLTVDIVHGHAIGCDQPRLRTADDTDRWLLSIGCRTEHEDALAELMRDDDLVARRVVAHAVHGASEHRLL